MAWDLEALYTCLHDDGHGLILKQSRWDLTTEDLDELGTLIGDKAKKRIDSMDEDPSDSEIATQDAQEQQGLKYTEDNQENVIDLIINEVRVIDLSNNKISDIPPSFEFFGSCEMLDVIDLRGNPLSLNAIYTALTNAYNYQFQINYDVMLSDRTEIEQFVLDFLKQAETAVTPENFNEQVNLALNTIRKIVNPGLDRMDPHFESSKEIALKSLVEVDKFVRKTNFADLWKKFSANDRRLRL